jgi:predicted nucleotidyltransferase
MITVPEAVRRARRNPETIRRWIREGKLRSRKIGTQHTIEERDLEAVLADDDEMLPLPPERQFIPDSARARRQVASDDWLPAIVGRIVRLADPIRIVLFGSRARGRANADSDYDLLVVLDDVENRREARIQLRQQLLDVPVAIDLVVAPSAEVQRDWRGVRGIVQWAAEDGRVVYERS